MFLRKADKIGLLLWMVLACILFFFLAYQTDLVPLMNGFLAITISTFLVMLVDKVQATQHDRRISERSLYLMTILGGSVGMLLAMYTIRHKSRKLSFQIVVWFLVLLQMGIGYLIYQTYGNK